MKILLFYFFFNSSLINFPFKLAISENLPWACLGFDRLEKIIRNCKQFSCEKSEKRSLRKCDTICLFLRKNLSRILSLKLLTLYLCSGELLRGSLLYYLREQNNFTWIGKPQKIRLYLIYRGWEFVLANWVSKLQYLAFKIISQNILYLNPNNTLP